MAKPEPLQLKNPVLAAILGWLVPGLGHFYQHRIGKGILFFVCVMGLFIAGMQQGKWQVVYFRWNDEEWRLPYLAQVGAGLVALPAFFNGAWRRRLPETLANFEAPPTRDEQDRLHFQLGKRVDLAVTYTMIAGLLNIMAVYDALAGPALYAEERKRLVGGERTPEEPAT
jgi:hypothetical protein